MKKVKSLIDADKLIEWARKNADDAYLSAPLSHQSDMSQDMVELTDLIGAANKMSIEFDADGWCWDMSKAPRRRWDNYCESKVIGLYSTGDEYGIEICHVVCDGNLFRAEHNERIELKAWRPLPTIPEVQDVS